MGIIDDAGKIPLKFAEEFYSKGYFIWIMLGLLALAYYIWGK